MEHYKLRGHIIGMILGDGHISAVKRKNGNVYCRASFSSTSLDYLKWKQEIIEQITTINIYQSKDSQGWNKKKLFNLGTKGHPLYLKLRMRMYNGGRRTIDPFLMKQLSKLGLLFWYLDDGSYDNRMKQIFIHSNGYAYSDHLVLQKGLNDYFGLRFNIHQKFKKSRGKRYCLLYLTAKDRLKFYEDIIEQYLDKIPNDLKYKIPIKGELIELNNAINKI